MRRSAARAVLVLSVLLAGCSANTVHLTVESDIPEPLVTRIPLHMGIYYSPALAGYQYTEDTEDRKDWQINSGESQLALFNQILPSMFERVQTVNDTPDAGVSVPVDGVIAPEINDMQFAMPHETKTDLYEAWIKYDMRLYDARGQLVSDWPITGYGKASTELLESSDDGLNEAINLALRDAGAKLALNFAKDPAVRKWLAEKTGDCERYGEDCQ